MNRPTGPRPDPGILQAIEALKANQPAAALRLLATVSQTHKHDPQLWFLMSSAHLQQGKMEEVIRYAQQALKALPGHVGVLCNLGNAYAAIGQQQRSSECFQQALRLAPRDPRVRVNLAEVMLRFGNTEGAIPHFEAALQLDPNLTYPHKRLGHIHFAVGHLPVAEDHYRCACAIDRIDVEAQNGYILAVGYQGRLDDALALLDDALAEAPGDPNLLATKAHLLERDGQHAQSFAVLTEIEERGAVTPISAATLTRICRRFKCCDRALASVTELLREPSLARPSRRALCFAAGALLDKLERYDDAFSYFRQANEAVPHPFDRAAHERYVTSLAAPFSAATIPSLPQASNTDHRPIFIVGMPRSGTTLVEQILASHPDVYGAGELGDLIDLANGLRDGRGNRYPAAMADLTPRDLDTLAASYLHKLDSLAPAAPRITDKMPQNYLHLGLIRQAFPEATIIHCRRNPADTCLSVYFQNFSWGYGWASDLVDIGLYYLQCDRLMRHWHRVLNAPILDVQYEELVADQERGTRRILDHCGLPWHDACLDFHETKRWVTTVSYDQVRKKLYSSSVARWRHYEPHIEPLLRTLAPLLPPVT